ncbi:MAG TPA: S8/S53 family peptidase [Tahibacter sp.]|nr:S8/S53 family peptidase [Tahibacter sp.]
MTSSKRPWISEYVAATGSKPVTGRTWGPKDLLNDRGFDMSRFGDGDAFIDRLLGYRIDLRAPPSTSGQPQSVGCFDDSLTLRPTLDGPLPFESLRHAPTTNGTAASAEFAKAVATPGAVWFARQFVPKWNKLTGKGQTVAILDSGIAPELAELPRAAGHTDFCDCEHVAADAYDDDGHGTCCAGVVAAHWKQRDRVAVAPDCRLLAAKITRNGNATTTLVDILLMLSWAVHRGARVVSMSFCASEPNVAAKGPPDILGTIAQRLRARKKALIFAAAVEQDGDLGYPAKLPGIIAVGPYVEGGTGGIVPWAATPDKWQRKHAAGELLFAPGADLPTLLPDGRGFRFGSASGACAFAAGLAALYFEQGLAFEKVLAEMRRRSTPVSPAAPPRTPLYCVKL